MRRGDRRALPPLRRRLQEKSHNPGVRFEERELEGRKWFLLSMHDASEFLSKKDYLKNWDIEVNEEFGTFTLEEWKEELEAAGYRVVEGPLVCERVDQKTNRYDGKVWLHADLGDRPGELLPFPDTTCVIVGEKLALAPRIRNILHKRFGRVASAASRLIELRRTVLRPGRKTRVCDGSNAQKHRVCTTTDADPISQFLQCPRIASATGAREARLPRVRQLASQWAQHGSTKRSHKP